MMRVVRKKAPRAAKLIAYDFETTRIAVGTPRPLYITAYGERPDFSIEVAIKDFQHLTFILIEYFLVEENAGCKFVAWNANNFDAYFIAAALITCDEFVLRPYLTRGNSLRGLRVLRKADADNPQARGWEFLDGMAMLGLVGVSLEKFLQNFAPDHQKMTGVIDWENEEFDPMNIDHCTYAMRDSVGLYKGMQKAQDILMELFDQPLAVTMGGACIKILKAHIPEEVVIRPCGEELTKIVRNYVMRGGFCYANKRYEGKVWKYDINQAYASAMRESPLPCGNACHSDRGVNRFARIYIVRITATNPRNKIPFYYRTERLGKMRAVFSTTEIDDTWITSTEHQQLKDEGWRIKVHESYFWEGSFHLKDYVDKLERGRMSAPGGPSGPQGTVYKNVGNHSYGKTVEQLEPIEFVLAAECPAGYAPYFGDQKDPLEHIYFRFTEEARGKDYHQPHVGAFITAYVRMVLRRAALLAPEAWLYADTDCVVFSEDVTSQLDIHLSRYGAWKIEEDGTPYQIIAKKVYAELPDPKNPTKKLKRSAKGLNVKKLTPEDFNKWFHGEPPVQEQVQRNNFVNVMQGLEMYRGQRRRGTAVKVTPETEGV